MGPPSICWGISDVTRPSKRVSMATVDGARLDSVVINWCQNSVRAMGPKRRPPKGFPAQVQRTFTFVQLRCDSRHVITAGVDYTPKRQRYTFGSPLGLYKV